MTNKQRREIIEKAKSEGYGGDYVELFRTGAAKLAITEEEREKGLRPYHEAGDTGQTMAFPNTPPNTPFNTVGMKAPIRVTKHVGGKVVKDQVVPPGVSSFNTGSGYGTVVEAPELRARGKYGRRRAQYGEAVARPELAPTMDPETGEFSSVPAEKPSEVSQYLDRAQIVLGAGSLAAAATGVGEVVSVPADLVNVAISFGRAGYYGLKGKGAKASKYAALGGLNVAAAIPVIGNVAGATSIGKLAQSAAQVPAVAKSAHMMHHGGEAAITTYKALDYATSEDPTRPNTTDKDYTSLNLSGLKKQLDQGVISKDQYMSEATGRLGQSQSSAERYISRLGGVRYNKGGYKR